MADADQPADTGNQMTTSQEAEVIRQTAASSVLAICLSKTFGKIIGSNGFRQYVDDVLATAAKTSDPIERMFIEQLVIAHHRIGDLQASAAVAENSDAAALYTTCAARLMSEFRRAALALREFRAPVAAPNVTVVGQQNVAAGDQQIALVNGKEDIQFSPEKKTVRSEVGSKNQESLTHEQPITLQPTPCRGREAQPIIARNDHARGAAAPSGSGAREPTVEAVDWPPDESRQEAIRGEFPASTEGRAVAAGGA